jgi:hypothetical protein
MAKNQPLDIPPDNLRIINGQPACVVIKDGPVSKEQMKMMDALNVPCYVQHPTRGLIPYTKVVEA